MSDRKLTFVRAGDQDVSEVTISTGRHAAATAAAANRYTYTISYPGVAPSDENPAMDAQADLREKFSAAAEAVIKDANERGVPIGEGQ
jgi:hypothetical protein